MLRKVGKKSDSRGKVPRLGIIEYHGGGFHGKRGYDRTAEKRNLRKELNHA